MSKGLDRYVQVWISLFNCGEWSDLSHIEPLPLIWRLHDVRCTAFADAAAASWWLASTVSQERFHMRSEELSMHLAARPGWPPTQMGGCFLRGAWKHGSTIRTNYLCDQCLKWSLHGHSTTTVETMAACYADGVLRRRSPPDVVCDYICANMYSPSGIASWMYRSPSGLSSIGRKARASSIPHICLMASFVL